MGVEVVPLVADHHELAGLVGGDQERRAELPQERGEVRRVDGLEWCRILDFDGVEVWHYCDGGTCLSHDFHHPVSHSDLC